MFVPVIEEVPDTFEVEGPGPNHVVLTPLAASEDGWRLVAVETRLLTYEDDGVLTHELQFSIVVLDEENGDVARIFDRDMARGFLPRDVLPLVMPCVCGAVRALIQTVQPQVIYRVTHATRPSDNALLKHQMITEELVELGIGVQECGTDPFGRQFWRMSKDGDEHGQG